MPRRKEPKYKAIPGRIEELWEQAGFKNKGEFAACCHLHPNTVGPAARGKLSTQSTLKTIARALKLSNWLDLLDDGAEENRSVLKQREVSLPQATDKMFAWERVQEPNIKLEVDSLAIDMSEGWRSLQLTANRALSTEIHFRILMLKGPRENLNFIKSGNWPPWIMDVLSWSDRSASSLLEFRQSKKCGFGASEKSVKIELKDYDSLPTIHGTKVNKGMNYCMAITRCFVLEGRPPKYDYGGDKYHFITGEGSARSLEGEAAEWQNRFDLLWKTGKTVFLYPPNE